MPAKGSVARSTLEFVRVSAGDQARERTLSLLDAETRARVERADATDELPYDAVQAVWRAADGVLGKETPDWMERAGAYAIESAGVQLYSGILRKGSPLEFLTQSVSLFQLFYRPGNMEVVYEAPGMAVLRLVGFDPGTPLFCRRLTGGLRCALTVAGGVDPRAHHGRCTLEGDAFCEWELAWASTPAA